MEIHIEFCVKWNYGPEFDRVSKIISEIEPKINIVGNRNLPRSGSFEVTINNKLIYSKFETGDFPTFQEIKSWFINSI